jgi:hypothetical protein
MRGFFLTMTVLITGLNFYLAYIFAMNSPSGLSMIPVITIVVYAFQIMFQLILGLILMILEKVEKPTDIIPPNFGFITFRWKKIYYSELGYFWTVKIKDRVYVYKQHSLYLKKLFDARFYGDIEHLRLDIKNELEEIYSEELKRKKIADNYKNWNGYIDLKSERDDKLNELGV